MVNEFIAVVIGYLLGSIHSAYIVTRLATGKDIRKFGSGNVAYLSMETYNDSGPRIKL